MAVVAVGHRGTNIGVPENSIISHNVAFDMGARGIEFDIRMSNDGEFVVFHDPNVKNKTNGKGKVKKMSVAQLQDLRLLHGGLPTSHHIPTLKEALENVQNRFMVDIDFKSGPDNSAAILRHVLHETGFSRDGAPLVTIFCRNKADYGKIKDLNDLYAVRPLYLNEKQAQSMSNDGVRVMGLRNYKFTSKRAKQIRNFQMQLFPNAMKLNLWNLVQELLGIPFSRKKPTLHELRKIYAEAIEGDSLFIQTDYLPELVTFLKERNVYQDLVLERNFQPVLPTPTTTQDSAIV